MTQRYVSEGTGVQPGLKTDVVDMCAPRCNRALRYAAFTLGVEAFRDALGFGRKCKRPEAKQSGAGPRDVPAQA